MPNITQIQVSNSTSYADVLGLQIGLDRLQGETTPTYLKRLEAAVRLRREHPYEGALNEVSLQLGFAPAPYISLNVAAGIVITSSIAGITVGSHPTVPLLSFDNDTMWKWRMLSDVVSDLNLYVQATLLVADGPAMQIARQTNSLWSFSESVAGVQTQLLNTGIIVGSELFNQSVPSYTLTSNGLITFSVEPNSGTEITYNHISAPYDLVGSPVSMIGFTDPEFASVAAMSNSALAYQVREFIQAIMLIDRSYWAD